MDGAGRAGVRLAADARAVAADGHGDVGDAAALAGTPRHREGVSAAVQGGHHVVGKTGSWGTGIIEFRINRETFWNRLPFKSMRAARWCMKQTSWFGKVTCSAFLGGFIFPIDF